jgi:chromosome segregation ATPase
MVSNSALTEEVATLRTALKEKQLRVEELESLVEQGEERLKEVGTGRDDLELEIKRLEARLAASEGEVARSREAMSGLADHQHTVAEVREASRRAGEEAMKRICKLEDEVGF